MSWGEMNEYVLLRIYSLLSTGDLASAGKVCRRWRGISRWAHTMIASGAEIADKIYFQVASQFNLQFRPPMRSLCWVL